MNEKIIKFSGGKDNIIAVDNCMTRLRLTLKDYDKANLEELKKIEGVLGVVSEGTLQLVIGPGKVKRVKESLEEYLKLDSEIKVVKEESGEKNIKKGGFLKRIASIFIPLIPALIGTGIINGVNAILKLYLNGAAEKSQFLLEIINVLGVAGTGFMAYFAIFVSLNAAKEFKVTPVIAGTLGGMAILPQVTGITAFGIKLIPGMGGIFTILGVIWIASKVEAWCKKNVHDLLDTIFTPLITLLVSTITMLYVIMPISGIISKGIVVFVKLLMEVGGPIFGFFISLMHLPLVILGLHHGLIPIHMELINSIGYTPLYPLQQMGGVSLLGAGFAILIKSKDKNTTNIAKATLPTMVMGIGEPILYGLVVPMFRPFITAIIGGGIGGAFLASFNVGLTAIGVPYFASWALTYGAPSQMFVYLIGVALAMTFGFIFTYFFGYKTGELDEKLK